MAFSPDETDTLLQEAPQEDPRLGRLRKSLQARQNPQGDPRLLKLRESLAAKAKQPAVPQVAQTLPPGPPVKPPTLPKLDPFATDRPPTALESRARAPELLAKTTPQAPPEAVAARPVPPPKPVAAPSRPGEERPPTGAELRARAPALIQKTTPPADLPSDVLKPAPPMATDQRIVRGHPEHTGVAATAWNVFVDNLMLPKKYLDGPEGEEQALSHMDPNVAGSPVATAALGTAAAAGRIGHEAALAEIIGPLAGKFSGLLTRFGPKIAAAEMVTPIADLIVKKTGVDAARAGWVAGKVAGGLEGAMQGAGPAATFGIMHDILEGDHTTPGSVAAWGVGGAVLHGLLVADGAPGFSLAKGLAAPSDIAGLTTDPYAILGVTPEATPAEINAAAKRRSSAYHPDVNKAPGSEDIFKTFQEARAEALKRAGAGRAQPVEPEESGGVRKTPSETGENRTAPAAAPPTEPVSAAPDGDLQPASELSIAEQRAQAEVHKLVRDLHEAGRPIPDPDELVRLYHEKVLAWNGELAIKPEPKMPERAASPREAVPENPEKRGTAVASIDPRKLRVDPARFQYKESHPTTGVTGAIADVSKWKPERAGLIAVWHDPTEPPDADPWVVNGHQRRAKALELGVPEVNTIEIHAKDAAEARLFGALINIGEGSGTALDAAKILRETGMDREKLRESGVPLTGKIAKDGMALAQLHEGLFDMMARGKLPVERAAVIGRSGLAPEQQMALFEILKKQTKELTNAQVEELARFVKSAGTEQVSQDSLFGTDTQAESLAIDKAKTSAWLMDRLGKQARLFKFVSKGERAGAIESEGAGKIDTEKAGQLGTEAGQVLEVYRRLSASSGPVSDALNQAVKQIRGGTSEQVVRAQLLKSVKAAVQEVLTGAGGAGGGGRAQGAEGGARADEGPGLALGEEKARYGEPAPGEVAALEGELGKKYRGALEHLELREQNDGTVKLDLIQVYRAERKRGIGTKVMEDIAAWADKHGRTITLSLAGRDAETTSRERLRKFYSRFGFVRNKGRNKDFRLSMYASMYRRPKSSGQLREQSPEYGAEKKESAPRFYSRLTRAIEKAPFKTAPASQWLGYLKNQSLSKAENEWVGLHSALQDMVRDDGDPKITGAEILAMEGPRKIAVTETVLGAGDAEVPQDLLDERDRAVEDHSQATHEWQSALDGLKIAMRDAGYDEEEIRTGRMLGSMPPGPSGPTRATLTNARAQLGALVHMDEDDLGYDHTSQAVNALMSEPRWEQSWPELSDRVKEAVKVARDARRAHEVAQTQPPPPEVEEAVNRVKVTEAAQRKTEQERDRANAAVSKAGESKRPEFSQYTEPGGENYREILVQLGGDAEAEATAKAEREKLTELPDDYEPITDGNKSADHRWGVVRKDAVSARPMAGSWPTKEIAIERALHLLNEERLAKALNEASKGQFRSGHFEPPDVVLHLRVKDRTYQPTNDPAAAARAKATGLAQIVRKEKVLFAEELQSDWAQKGRKQGFAGEQRTFYDIKVNGDLFASRPTREAAERFIESTKAQAPEGGHFATREYTIEEKTEDRQDAVPDMPFKKTEDWVELGLKRLLAEAAEKGYDRVAWANGQQSADRYDLRKYVARIEYDQDREQLRAYDSRGNIVISHNEVLPDKLADYIGKGPAERLTAQEPTLEGFSASKAPDGDWTVYRHDDSGGRTVGRLAARSASTPEEAIEALVGNTRSIIGEDLAVGGEGMVDFYDKIIPNVAKKYLKSLGGTVEPIEMRFGMDDERAADGPTRAEMQDHASEYATDAEEDEKALLDDWAENGVPDRAHLSEQDALVWDGLHDFVWGPEGAPGAFDADAANEQGDEGDPRDRMMAAIDGFIRDDSGIAIDEMQELQTWSANRVPRREETDFTELWDKLEEYADENGHPPGWDAIEADAIAGARDANKKTVLSIPMTPELRSKILGEGQRLMEKGPEYGAKKKKPKPTRLERAKAMGFDTDTEVYHGTTHDFDEFSAHLGNPENHYGKAYYFTDSPDDASRNYAGEGPDLTSRIEQRVDRMTGTDESAELSDEEIRAKARAEIVGPHEGAVIPAFLKIKNPVIVTPDGGTRFEIIDERNEDGDVLDQSGNGLEIADAFRQAANQFDSADGQKLSDEIIQAIYEQDGITATELENLVRESENAMYANMDETGEMAVGELVRRAYEIAGFDGIVQDAGAAFGSGRKFGQPMMGADYTTHYIVFHPNQIRSTFAKFDPKKADSGDILAEGKSEYGKRKLPKVIGGEVGTESITGKKLRAEGFGRMQVEREWDPYHNEPWAIDNAAYRQWNAARKEAGLEEADFLAKGSPGVEYDRSRFLEFYARALKIARDGGPAPLFAVIPDRIGDAAGTMAEANEFLTAINYDRSGLTKDAQNIFESDPWGAQGLRHSPVPLYLPVQDGMTTESLEAAGQEGGALWDHETDRSFLDDVAGIFLGGGNEYKAATAQEWSDWAHAHGMKFHYARAGTGKKLRHAVQVGADSVDSALPQRHMKHWRAFTNELERQKVEIHMDFGGAVGENANLFGEVEEPATKQGELLGGGPQGVSAALDQARATVSKLQGKMDRGVASPSEKTRYAEAQSLIRRQEGKGLGAGEVKPVEGAQEPAGETPLDLFGPVRERQQNMKEQFSLTFGSVPKAMKLAKEIVEIAGPLAQVSIPGVVRAEDRIEAVTKGRQAAYAWVPATGHVLAKANGEIDKVSVFRLLKAYRHPGAEYFHLMVAVPDIDGFRIVHHHLTSTGSLDMALVNHGDVLQAATIAKKLGGKVIRGHNHPSGIPKPSTDDRTVDREIQATLNRVGAEDGGHYVINHEDAVLLDSLDEESDVPIHLAAEPGAQDWTNPDAPFTRSPEDVFRYLANFPMDENRVDVLMLTTQHQIAAWAAKPLSEVGKIGEWLPELRRNTSTAKVVIGVHGPDALARVRDAINGLPLGILDVLDSSRRISLAEQGFTGFGGHGGTGTNIFAGGAGGAEAEALDAGRSGQPRGLREGRAPGGERGRVQEAEGTRGAGAARAEVSRLGEPPASFGGPTKGPGTGGSAGSADDIKAILRNTFATRAHRNDIAAAELETAVAEWEKPAAKAEAGQKAAQAEIVDFIDAIEHGATANLPPKQKAAAATVRSVLDKLSNELRTRGLLDTFRQDYFGRIWRDPDEKVLGRIFGKRPLRGPRGFKKKRSYDFFREGYDAGLQPIDWNPFAMELHKIAEMNKAIAAHDLVQELKARGMIHHEPGRVPDGYQRISDDAFTVYQRGPNGETILRGHWVAPTEVAQVLNRYLTPSPIGNLGFVKALRFVNNALNQIQLLGLFHAGFVSVDSVLSRIGIGMVRAFDGAKSIGTGNIGVGAGEIAHGLKQALSAPAAPALQAYRGNKLMQAWRSDPALLPAGARELIEAIERGGGRGGADARFHTQAVKSFKRALSEGTPKGMLKAVGWATPAAAQAVTAPILEWFVPRVKLAAFADMARYELEKLPGGPLMADPMEQRRVLQDAWRSVDERLGQVVYDNLFWDPTVKEAAHLAFRSVGWSWGSLSLGAKGVAQAPLIFKGKLTHSTAYLFALVLGIGTADALIQYLMTGEKPKDLKDLAYPRTGHMMPDGTEERLALPSYIKDFYSWGTHPLATAGHKLSPMLSVIAEAWQNEDFYGTQIVDPDSPWTEQMKQLGAYAARTATPLSVRSIQQFTSAQEGGAGPAAIVGVAAAPASVRRSKFQGFVADRFAESLPRGARKPDQVAASKREGEATTMLRRADSQKLTDQQRRDLLDKSGYSDLTPAQRTRVLSRSKIETDEYRFQRLPLELQIKAYNLADDDERKDNNLLKHIFSGTLPLRLKNLTPDARATVEKELDAIRSGQQAQGLTVPTAPPPGARRDRGTASRSRVR